MAGDGTKRSQVSSIPPRKINVQNFAEARASELESLNSIVENRLNNDFRSRRNKRRRTTSYDNKAAKRRYAKRRKIGVLGDKSSAVVSEQDQERALPRRIRRRVELKKNAASGFSTSGDGTKRLRTHVWHAKRFTMTKLWGFHLPLGLQGKGRGSRALLKWYKNGALVHDASYCTAIQLEGPQDSLTSILRTVLESPPSVQSEENANAILSGAIYGSAMLRCVGVPGSRLIAPVTYMWRPHDLNAEKVCDGYDSTKCDEPHTSVCSSSRQLWVWIHASAFQEAYDTLKFACEEQMNESGSIINCFSLEGQLAKLEVMGSKAFQLLQNIILPVSCNLKNLWQLRKHHVEEADIGFEFKSSLLEKEENIDSCSVLSLTVRDPRETPPKIKNADIPLADASKAEPENNVTVSVPGNLEKHKELLSPSASEPKGDGSSSDERNLWDINSRLSLPVEESVLCSEKHHNRMDFLCIDDKKSGKLTASTEVQCSRYCPILLLKNNIQMGSFMGWSIILPLSWAKVFWVPFISKGAHAIGLREKRWVASEAQLPYFPSDFPDCKAYLSFMANELANAEQEAERRPNAVRPLKVPIPPLWNSVLASMEKRCLATEGVSNSNAEATVNDNNLSNSTTTLTVDSNSFNATVARTSDELTAFMNEINGYHVLLFPRVANGKSFELMKNESNLAHPQNGFQISDDRKICFVRVLLRAYKEGFFEEGAVVCAPSPIDVSQWTSRTEIDRSGLQLPQHLISSYFKEKSCGKWEMQVPEDPAARESYRWPIGFVTTGFVRGSKKPVAEAFCEAILLAELRKEQWNEMEMKRRRKEIYVLVRNLRSSAYRLALASIVLEQQEDMEFL
ncbi:Ribonucleases P/MRP protein subunit POP1 [Euphorbia peplus]|nr:Ribonucleases P/MRP protein subunit POP1 [Euphorbia peplus]